MTSEGGLWKNLRHLLKLSRQADRLAASNRALTERVQVERTRGEQLERELRVTRENLIGETSKVVKTLLEQERVLNQQAQSVDFTAQLPSSSKPDSQ